MGHIGHLKEEYRELVRRLQGGQVAMPEPADPRAWGGWKDILEIMYSPEEAELASKLPTKPSSLEQIARRLKMPAAELKPRLDAMCDKGLALDIVNAKTGKIKYLLAPPVVGFFEFSLMRAHDSIPKKKMAEALEAYTHFDDAFAREAFGHETVIGRALVHESALDDDVSSHVLDWEKATAIINDATKCAVSLCYCRHKAEHLGKDCKAPKETCLSFNAGADFVIRRKFGREIERSEALRLMTEARESGLVQIGDNVLNKPTYICNCCGCCCGQLQAINEFDLRAVNPSGFLAAATESKCTGCSRCARACPIGAISMTPRRLAATQKSELFASIADDRCIGCGVCADTCRKDSMKMHRRATQPHVPQNSIERAVRMAVERGRLAQLLFDEGESRGMAFMNRVLRAVMSLPPAERLMASRQVQSRFVKAALARVKDPTGA